MKDLSSADTFSNNQVEFKKAQKRVIRTSEWDDKLREIQEWIAEQEREKGRQIQDDLGNNDAYQQPGSISVEERRAQMEANRKTAYEEEVAEIRSTLGFQTQNSASPYATFGQTGHNSSMNSSFANNGSMQQNNVLSMLYGGPFFKGFILGRELTQAEPDNNKRLLKKDDDNKQRSGFGRMRMGMGMNPMGNRQPKVFESQDEQNFRMQCEDWQGYLGAYRTSGALTFASGVLTVLKIKVLLFIPSYFVLIPSLAGLAYLSAKLKDFQDGPLSDSRNLWGSDSNLKQRKKLFKKKKEEEKKQAEKDKNKRPSFGGGRFGGNRTTRSMGGRANGFGGVNNGVKPHPTIKSFDDDDLDDKETSTFDEDMPVANKPEIDIDNLPKDGPVPTPHEVLDKESGIGSHDYVGDMLNNDNELDPSSLKELLMVNPDNVGKYEIPHSRLSFDKKDQQKIFDFEEDFLRWVFDNRKTFAQLHKPSELLKVFAPLIPEYNKGFAAKKEVARDSITFKNIVYVLTKTFSEISNEFANANEHDPAFYFCLDKIEETSLFYKAKIRLPQSISKSAFERRLQVLVNTLKNYDGDIVDVSLEMANSEGYVKIMKIVVRDGAGYLPLVSTGDVMRFKGMKANRGKTDLIKELDKPNDLSFLIGLNSAEYARVLDIGGNQNTSCAVIGGTGSGKTASFGSWLLNLIATHSPDEVGIIIMDAKSGSFWENFKYTPHVLGYFGREDIDKYPTIYNILSDICTYRQNYLNKEVRMKNYTEARKRFKKNLDWDRLMKVPRLIVISDEIAATLAGLDTIDKKRESYNKGVSRADKKYCSFFEDYKTQTRACVQIVRESGITMVGISQRAVDKSFPRDFLSGTTIRLMMKLEFQSDAERVTGENNPPNVSNLPTGSGYVRANGLPLSQLTIPLYSGEPDLLEEFARIMGLAWTIIQSYKENLEKEPLHYYLTEATSKRAGLFNQYGIEPFNLFNRDSIYREAKEILRTGHNLHFSPEAQENGGFSIDLDTADSLWREETPANSHEDKVLTEEVNNTPQFNPVSDEPESVSVPEQPLVEDKPIEKEPVEEPTVKEQSLVQQAPGESDTNEKEPVAGVPSLEDLLSRSYKNVGKPHEDKALQEKSAEPNESKPPVEETTEEPVAKKTTEEQSLTRQEPVKELKRTSTSTPERVLNRKPINREVEKQSNPEPTRHTVKIDKKKNDLTVSDLRRYFIDSGINSMKLDDLLETFNYNTIKNAINQGILSIDSHSHEVTLL